MAVSREQVFEVLQRVHPALERGLPGWSVRPNITGTGAVGLYLDGPELPLMGVNLAGTVELTLGTQGAHIPHGGPVHHPHLRSTSKELRMPTACTGVVAFDGGRARGQDTQLG